MRNKFVMSRSLNVRFLKKRMVRYVFRSMVLARYDVTYEQAEQYMWMDNPQTEEEIAAVNFRKAFECIIDSADEEADYKFLLKLHHLMMEGLDEGIKSTLSDEQIESLHVMINQPAKANTEIALEVMLFILDKRLFSDGDVRVAIMFANKIMVDNGNGVISINDMDTEEFRTKLKGFKMEDQDDEFKNWIYRTSVEGRRYESYDEY